MVVTGEGQQAGADQGALLQIEGMQRLFAAMLVEQGGSVFACVIVEFLSGQAG
jgi:hypothetical protein